MNTKEVTEGVTTVAVPVPPEEVNFPPSQAPVFYNPHMELNRDISVAATSAFVKRLAAKIQIPISDITYVDTMAASGIRGLRIAREVGVTTSLNDWSQDAYDLIGRNIEMNDLLGSAAVSCKNANVLLHEEHFNIVDLDPFGSPAPYLDAAARSAVHLLEVTATDTAPLCGAHLNSGIRKYAAVPLNNEYHSEMGIRILLGKVARELAKHDKAMIPLLSHATRHYVRAYLQIKRGAKHADKALRSMGFISHCPICVHRELIFGMAIPISGRCSLCGSSTIIAGPLWLGQLHETKFCEEVLDEIENRPLNMAKNAKKIIATCSHELDIPTFYDQHLICKDLGLSASTMDEFIGKIQNKGFKVSRTHFSGTSFKTNADIDQIKRIFSSDQ